ncbi:hypothetical protein PC129_g20310 [Phytophthora cactorum]|uniref:Uncharacterized protein n=1 Tax=Phytophthora cactorum TaxID=29920 RepID=A0A8T1JZH5_9STRA|nr:hypothetical protein PC117_g16013 [Phytophthora cactorum]KAG3208666.1 hypothetical protein PC129_g20310 [Phytophthora cactorum]KAG4228468.1 hypothetical protein PC116_g23177 [Phytophthora cactorum]
MSHRVNTRTKAQAHTAPGVGVRDVNFRTLWRQLTAEGRTSKRPTRLARSWSYFTPEAAKDGHVEGVNMFTEAAVVKYAVEKGIVGVMNVSTEETVAAVVNRKDEFTVRRLESLVGSDSEEDLQGQTADMEDDEHESITASQIDTTVGLSANTVDVMFGGAQSEEEEAVVMMASLYAVQESPTSPLATSRIATSLAAEPMTPTTPVRHAAVAESTIPLVPVNPDDVNIMKEDDVADDYESVDSLSDGVCSSGEDHVVPRQLDTDISSDEDETSLMDAAFIDCLGGSLAIEDNDQSTRRSMAWTAPFSQFESEISSFEGLSREVARPSAEIISRIDSPLDLLLYFMPKKLWTYITRETTG